MTSYFGENKPCEDFSRRSLCGGLVSIGARVFNAFVQMASVVVLAHLLSPEDYGLISMVGAIIGVAALLMDLGIRDAVIQHRFITPEEISALFWITVAFGCGSAVAGAASGPLIAHFYGEPRLATVALISSLSFIALSLSYQHQALLRRAMMYQELALIDIDAAYAVIAVGLFRVRTPLQVGRSVLRACVA